MPFGHFSTVSAKKIFYALRAFFDRFGQKQICVHLRLNLLNDSLP